MRPRRTYRQETFGPLRDKTLYNVLRHQFVTEFGYGDKVIFAEAMIERLLETISAFTEARTRVKPGQMVWMAVADDGYKHAKQRMRDTPQVAVVLDLVTEEELAALEAGQDYKAVRQQRMARLLRQAYAQGGVLAQSDLAAIMLWAASVASQDLAAYQEANDCILPYPGSVQDLGSTVTHKVEVIRLLEAGFLEPEICERLDIPHNLRQVENYVQTYKNVLKLLERGCSPEEVASILSIGQRLVNSYLEIVEEHHPELLEADRYPGQPVDASLPG